MGTSVGRVLFFIDPPLVRGVVGFVVAGEGSIRLSVLALICNQRLIWAGDCIAFASQMLNDIITRYRQALYLR